MSRVVTWLTLLACASCSAEAAEPMPDCVELSPSCSPLYPPTFDEVFVRTLVPTCGQVEGACHSADKKRGGLAFSSDDPDGAHAALLEKGRLRPGDPACSELVVRTHRAGHPWSMPPKTPLSAQEACALRLWVEAGALR